MKYLDVWFDDLLNWLARIQKLSLQLAGCCNMLYHIRDFVNALALVMLCYSFVYSRLTYGITAWGTAAQDQLREIESQIKQYHAYHMTWNKIFSHGSQLYKKLGFLKLLDVYKLELAKFMHKAF